MRITNKVETRAIGGHPVAGCILPQPGDMNRIFPPFICLEAEYDVATRRFSLAVPYDYATNLPMGTALCFLATSEPRDNTHITIAPPPFASQHKFNFRANLHFRRLKWSISS